MNISQVLIKPVLTEKSVRNTKLDKYTFIVHENATKIDVKNALKSLYGVKVVSVNILKNLPKYKFGRGRKLIQKRSESRRAIITLKKGETLDLSKLHGEKKAKKKTTKPKETK
jgi:large subunit ribosomal protein L23